MDTLSHVVLNNVNIDLNLINIFASAESTDLVPVAAHLHVAPAARPAAGRINEEPGARRVGTQANPFDRPACEQVDCGPRDGTEYCGFERQTALVEKDERERAFARRQARAAIRRGDLLVDNRQI